MKNIFIFMTGIVIAVYLMGCAHMDDSPDTGDSGISLSVPVKENKDHAAMLQSSDPKLAANKRLVYDFWRTLLEAHDTEAAQKYLDENYIQHNPMVDTGRDGLLTGFSSMGAPRPIQDRIQKKLVAIVAEKDLVVLVQVDEQTTPHPYTTTWFDMFRVKDGVITEHWDHGTLPEGRVPRHYVPVKENPNQQRGLANKDPKLLFNKQRVYEMWRVLLDAQQVEEAPAYLEKNYIQHNPMVPTGLESFMTFFRQFAQEKPVEPELQDFVEMVAEDDLVVLATVATYEDANHTPYTTTWFDMFRLEDGLMAEHWDTARLPVGE